jgi:Flp pilus assembly protein TadG
MKNSPHSRRLSSLTRDLSECESGNALIELAASLPLYLVLILGTAEIANLAWASVQVNNAARAAAAYASQSRANSSPLNIANIALAAQNEAPKFITAPSQVISTQLCSCVTGGTPAPLTCDANALSDCPSPSTIQVSVQVNIQAPVTPFVHYPGLPATYTVNAQATMGVTQ